MSLQFIRHSVYTRGLKNFKNRNIPDAWKSSAAVTAAGIVHKPMMRVPCGVKHTALGGDSGLKLGFQFGSHYIYNMRCNRKDRETERGNVQADLYTEKHKPRDLLLELLLLFLPRWNTIARLTTA